MYKLIIKPSAEKKFDKLPVNIKLRITAVLERTRIRPEKYFKRLTGEKLYRLRVGQYRIIAEIKKDELIILVIKIGHRKNVYKK